MNSFLDAALLWMIIPALALARRGRRRAAWAFLTATPLLAAGPDVLRFAWASAAAGFAALTIFLLRRSSRSVARRVGVRTRGLRGEARRARLRVEDLAREARSRSAALERLQNRFALVQGMATRLDTVDLLRSLGALWSEVPGVRRVLLLQRRPNGNWGVAFNHGLPSPETWVHFLETQPDLIRGKRLRKHAALDRLPFLRDHGLEPPFFLVPVAWGEDVMAWGYVEVSPALFEEGEAGFDTERKLVSIGLRRAFLYDLMSERSRHDGLTGALLRRTFMERLQESVRKSLRYKTPLFAAVFDVDHFKAVNDTYGHPAGDRALVQTVRLVREMAEPGVTLGRMGGDEFALVMEFPSPEDALSWTERLRAKIAATPLREGGRDVPLTISVGVSSFFPEKPVAETLLARADEALYLSKRGGRNRVSVPPPAASLPERS